MEKTSKVKPHPNHAHWPCHLVPRPHGSGTPLEKMTPPVSWAACANALLRFLFDQLLGHGWWNGVNKSIALVEDVEPFCFASININQKSLWIPHSSWGLTPNEQQYFLNKFLVKLTFLPKTNRAPILLNCFSTRTSFKVNSVTAASNQMYEWK